MINVFEAITKESGNGFKIFLAGGITNCPNWQSDLITKLRGSNITIDIDIYNPRRENFPINDPKASYEQILWEFDKLKSADMIVFWFSRGSSNPIVLYELGMWGNSRTTSIIIGIDNEYERKQDVIIQTNLARSELPLLCSLDRIVEEIENVISVKTKEKILNMMNHENNKSKYRCTDFGMEDNQLLNLSYKELNEQRCIKLVGHDDCHASWNGFVW